MSPRPVISTLITSAPIHAKSCVPVGPAWTWLKSRIRTPSSALLIVRLNLIRHSRESGNPGLPLRRSPLGPAFAGVTVFLGYRGARHLVTCRVEKIAVLLDMRGKPQRVLAAQSLGQVGVAPLQRLDYPQMVGNRTPRPVFLMDRDLADSAHVDEQVCCHLAEQG